MGTLVRDGHGSGIVVATAGQTVFGSVFEMMSDIEKSKPHCNKQWINWEGLVDFQFYCYWYNLSHWDIPRPFVARHVSNFCVFGGCCYS